MKASILRTFVAVAALVIPAFGQLSSKLQVRVPFDFQVGGAELSAGTYLIDTLGSPTVVRLMATHKPLTPDLRANAAVALTIPSSSNNWREPTVSFRCYSNDRCFIASVALGFGAVEFRRGHAEIVTSTLVASAQPRLVLLAARRVLP